MMNKIWKRNSVFSLRKRLEEGDAKGSKYAGGGCRKVLKRFTVQLVATVLIVSTIGLGSLWFSQEPETERFDLDESLDNLDLPQRVPYLASSSVLAGGATGDEFGYSVANAGDFNGDGKDDVIVGAPEAGDYGKAYIFFGGVSPTTPDVTIYGDETGKSSSFGHSVAGGGDFDNDGSYDEVIVGDPGYDGSKGKAYIFEYDPLDTYPATWGANDKADKTVTGDASNDDLGTSVAFTGNFDNDKGEDIIVGVPGYDSDKGQVWLLLSDGIGQLVDAKITGESSSEFGSSLSYAGDFNDDNYDDMIVGAPDYSSGKGRAYIIHGSTNPGSIDVTHQGVTKITGEDTGDNFGYSVAYAGDVNNDGDDDVIVGAPFRHFYYTIDDAGEAYIFLGSVTGGTSIAASNADKKLTGDNSAYGEFGISVSAAGDYNDDSYDDVIVGAHKEDTFAYYGTDAGKAHIFYGGSSMDEKADITMVGEPDTSTRYRFGWSVSIAGDFDPDGYVDVIVGAPEASSSKGYAHVYNFHDHFTTTGVTSYGGERRGYSVASGQINGGAYSDIIVGAPYYSEASDSDMGKVYVFKGTSTGIDSTPIMTLTEGDAEDYFGWSVSSGNFNGDMFDDVIVGAPGYSGNTGRAYIFYGGIFPNSVVDVILTGDNAGDKFGYSVDGAETHANPMISYDDAIVGAPLYDDGPDTDAGRVYVYFGGRPMNAGWDVSMYGDSEGDQFGYSVSNAGNFDGDTGNSEDVIVGAPFSDGHHLTDVGRVYIFYGSSTGLGGTSMWAAGGQSSYSWFGTSVSTAGDFRGDGCVDVIVGAPGYSGSRGRAYMYPGCTIPWAMRVLDGEAAGDQFGASVSTAGDVDNDGKDDVVVGAIFNDAGGTNAGRVYIYYGTTGYPPEMTYAKEDVYMTGRAGETLGWSVASAGDVNNDNYDDVVTGGQAWSSGRGRVRVWGDPS